ncbi:putative cytochrome 89A2-like [Capsicum annuum]|uniref:SLH domain-containing protein n=2 Tax=Capsicum annuum TaxID=4072 RepID=A0A2G2ZZ54_CAPAN|nr:uncharacterized protein LOC107863269 isoform X1 [Capsicum annuum]KAF3674895.1 putative cytochrome 89A2-like [Capsicum annuum]KAF3677415.1 putative cytochrome 89A2-like [Capsicum annuum]PHT87262.1 hypothetical protein T459_09368 [Capsicum annuum]
MSSLTTTWCPNSFQLRLALRSKKPCAVNFAGMRFGKLDYRGVRLVSFNVKNSNVSNGSGAGVEKTSGGDNSSAVEDGFAGWSGNDGAQKPNDSQGKQNIAGLVGAGAAGIILVSGLTFAALSISRRSSTRIKQQMEPLTEQQEMSINSDNHNDTVPKEKVLDENETKDKSDEELQEGIKDPSLYTENVGAIESRISGDTDDGHPSNDGVIVDETHIQYDLGDEKASDDAVVATEALSESPEATFGMSSYESEEDSLGAGKSEPTTEPERKNFSDDEVVAVSVLNPNSTYEVDNQVGVSILEGSGYSETSLDSAPIEPSNLNTVVNPHSEALLEPMITHEDHVETQSSFSTTNVELSKMAEVPSGGDKPSFDVQKLNRDEVSGTTSVPTTAYDHLGNDFKDMNASRSSFYSMDPDDIFVSAGIPAPSTISPALQALPGKVLVPASFDQIQGQALAALQALKVIESDVQPGDLCSRREYARWLVSASSALSRTTISKVYPAMYIENVTDLAFDDITPNDPDFPSIQGLAEAGLLSSKLSRLDMQPSSDDDQGPVFFCPESPLSRQDLVSWKMAIEKRQLPIVDQKSVQKVSGFIDVDKIHPDAWPALVADLTSGEQGIVALAFGYTRLFQPDKPVTKAQAAIALATGEASDIVGEELARIEAESMAEKAVAAHNALVAEVEKDVNASFEKELLLEREKIDAVEKLAEEARRELESLRAQREEENLALLKERAAVDSEMEVLSRLRREVEEQLHTLMSDKLEISYDKERIDKLRKDTEFENQEIARLQYELEVERKALSLARTWAEDEAKKAREQAKALEEARDRWQKQGIKVVVDNDLQEEADAGVTWQNAGNQSVESTVNRAETLVDKLKGMADTVRGKSREIIHMIIEKIMMLINMLKEWALKAGRQTVEFKDAATAKMGSSVQGMQQSSAEVGSAFRDGVKRFADDCRGGVEKISQKFKT